VALEEESVEAKARCDHATDRAAELKKLLDTVVDEEQVNHRHNNARASHK